MLNVYARWISGLAVTATVIAASATLQGCAAPLAIMGGSAIESGTGALVKTGTESTMGGTVRRTFTIPMEDVHTGILRAFERTDIRVKKDDASDKGRKMFATAEHRKVNVKLTPISRNMTLMTLAVKRNAISKDKATTSELLEQIEQVLAETPKYARRLNRDKEGPAAASPR